MAPLSRVFQSREVVTTASSAGACGESTAGGQPEGGGQGVVCAGQEAGGQVKSWADGLGRGGPDCLGVRGNQAPSLRIPNRFLEVFGVGRRGCCGEEWPRWDGEEEGRMGGTESSQGHPASPPVL